MIRRLALASALFVAVGSAAPSMAVAGSNTSNLDISASVPSSCTISTVGLTFDSYSYASGLDTDGVGTVSTNCTVNTTAVIKLDQGNNFATNSSNTAPLRRLKNTDTTNYLNYTLYQNSAKTTIWGDSTNTGVTLSGDGSDGPTTVYGRIPGGQSVPAGSYSDTVTATVTF
jgi:spore coat protein U-like protein